nr:hypothetical protein [Tanacetum cinerariifolium]
MSAVKLPILNPNEFDFWKIRIEQYFLMTNYSLWEVILNGDSPVPTRVIKGNGYSRNRQKPGKKRQNQTQSGKDRKGRSQSKPEIKSQNPWSTKVNPEEKKVNPDKAEAEK